MRQRDARLNPVTVGKTFTPRAYQDAGIANIANEYRSGVRATLFVLPCGGGKTWMFVTIANRAAAKGNKTLILVHRRELVRQASDTLDAMGLQHGLIAAGEPFTDAMVQVASVQTLVRRLDKIPWSPDLVVIDEAHHSIRNSTWGKVVSHYQQNAHVLGVTATPERLSGEGLGIDHDGFFESMVVGPQPSELIAQGHLVEPVVYGSPITKELSGVPSRMGDFVKEGAGEALNKPRITGDVITHYRKHCHQEPVIAFCSTVKHAHDVADEFMRAGYSAVSVDGKLDHEIRKQRIADLGSGDLNVLTSCEIISEGVDVPVVRGAILLRPTKSLGLFIQQSTRALRPSPGKTHAVIMDHVGNCVLQGHGMPHFDRDWSIEAKKRSQRKDSEPDIQVKQCKGCWHVFMAGPLICPKCGEPLPIQKKVIEQVEGTLEELDAAQVRKAMKRAQGMAKTKEDLIKLGIERGYKSPHAWAHFIYNSRQRRRGAA